MYSEAQEGKIKRALVSRGTISRSQVVPGYLMQHYS